MNERKDLTTPPRASGLRQPEPCVASVSAGPGDDGETTTFFEKPRALRPRADSRRRVVSLRAGRRAFGYFEATGQGRRRSDLEVHPARSSSRKRASARMWRCASLHGGRRPRLLGGACVDPRGFRGEVLYTEDGKLGSRRQRPSASSSSVTRSSSPDFNPLPRSPTRWTFDRQGPPNRVFDFHLTVARSRCTW